MNKLFKNFWVIFQFLLFMHLASYENTIVAQENRIIPQPIQEVFQSNLVYPQEKNEIQFTFFPSYRQGREAKKFRTLLEIEYGVSDAFQLIAEWDGFLHQSLNNGKTNSGVGNLELGAQYSWMGLSKGNTHFSLGSSIEIPTGPVKNGLTDGLLEWGPFFVFAQDIPKWNQSQISLEIGYNWVDLIRTSSDNAEERDNLFWNIVGFFPLGSWRGTLEINGRNFQWDNRDKRQIYLTPGVIYKLSKEWEIGLGTPIGLTDESDDYRAIGYLMWEFEID